MKKRVCILISTYNGEKYIGEQIDSILKQTFDNWILVIRDDGSLDNTKEILVKYAQVDERINVIPGDNVGFEKSFFELLRCAPSADYYAFADQDDIWIDDRLGKSILRFESNNAIPEMVCCNYYFYNDETCKQTLRFRREPRVSLANALMEPTFLGFTQMINSKAREIIVNNLERHGVYSHDWWSYMVCAGLGKVIYEPAPCVNYRRHANNVSYSSGISLKKYFVRFKKYFKNGYMSVLQNQCLDFNQVFGQECKDEDRKLLELFSSDSLINCIKKCLYKGRYRQRCIEEILLRVMMLLGRV